MDKLIIFNECQSVVPMSDSMNIEEVGDSDDVSDVIIECDSKCYCECDEYLLDAASSNGEESFFSDDDDSVESPLVTPPSSQRKRKATYSFKDDVQALCKKFKLTICI